MSLTNVIKSRPHRPHRPQCGCLRDFLAGGIVTGHRPRAIGHRPPRQLPPADRPPGNEPFCGAFSSPLVIAVGAVGTFTPLTRQCPSVTLVGGLSVPVQLREHAREGGSQRPGQLVGHGPRRCGLLVQPRVLERRFQRESGPSRFPIYRATVP